MVLLKGKPIPEGLKYYVLSESDSGYILNAFLQHKKLKTEKEAYGSNFGIVVELLEGRNINGTEEYNLLDQGYTVCFYVTEVTKTRESMIMKSIVNMVMVTKL